MTSIYYIVYFAKNITIKQTGEDKMKQTENENEVNEKYAIMPAGLFRYIYSRICKEPFEEVEVLVEKIREETNVVDITGLAFFTALEVNRLGGVSNITNVNDKNDTASETSSDPGQIICDDFHAEPDIHTDETQSMKCSDMEVAIN